MSEINAGVDALVSTGDAVRWQELQRPQIQKAGWLTTNLVRGEVLPGDFQDARVAPVVVGLSTLTERRRDVAPVTLVKSSVDTEYLSKQPVTEFFPHEAIKKHVRSELDRRANGRKGETVLFPGYIFPDVAGGTLYLDDGMFDRTCDIRSVIPAARLIGQMFGIAGITVGHRPVIRNQYTYVPAVSVPSVIRTALAPGRSGRISPNANSFAAAKRRVFDLSIDG